MATFTAEFTDTYGGEANYSWCKRYQLKAKTWRGAIREAKALQGLTKFRHRLCIHCHDFKSYRFSRLNQILFITIEF